MNESRVSGRVLLIITILAFILLYLPLVSVVLFSFNAGTAPVLPMRGLTLSWFGELFLDDDIRRAAFTSISIGLSSVVVCMVLGTPAALALRGRTFRGRGAYEAIIGLPLLIPEIITGTGLVTLFTIMNVKFSFWTILAGHVVITVGAGFRVIAGRAEALPRSLEEASNDLGRGVWGTLWHVTLPGMASALVTAALVVFALSFDQTLVTVFLTGTDNTLPTLLFSRMRIGFNSELNALATVLLFATVLLMVPAILLSRKESKR